MDKNFMAGHIICTTDEKRSCMKTVEKLLLLAQKARCCGLLELEKTVRKAEYQELPLLPVAFALIIDGTEPKLVEEIIENYLLSSDFSNRDFLDNSLILVGALAIQQGENPNCIKEKLFSLFGISFREELYHFFDEEEYRIETEELWALHKEKLLSLPKTELLNTLLIGVDRNSIQRLIMEIPASVLETAMIGCGVNVIRAFLCNMSERRQRDFFNHLNVLQCITKKEIELQQKEVAKAFHKLECSGEIIGHRRFENRMLTQEEINQCLNLSEKSPS